MSRKRVTISDVAREAGVSKATVSAVVNHTGTIAAATRSRVQEVIDRLNYRPGAPARSARGEADPSIGMLIREINNPYHVEVAAGARQEAEENGYGLMVTSSAAEYQTERKVVERLLRKDLHGLIITPVLHESADLSYLYDLKRRGIPHVLLAGIWGVQASLVDVDNVEASRQAVAYLIEQGHTRIAHLAGPRFSMHSQERIEGVRRAFSESHLRFTADLIVPAGSHLEDGYQAGLGLYGSGRDEQRPTAVTCYNDLVALGLCRALAELNLSVPDDVSVIGYGDLPILEYLPLPLTTVRVPKFEMGQMAARMLIRQLRSGAVDAPERVNLETELVVRQSTRPFAPPGEASAEARWIELSDSALPPGAERESQKRER
jgi:LacI family transcriptional regulator